VAAVSLAELVGGLRFVARLPSVLRRPLDLEVARSALASRIRDREADFLARVRDATADRSGNPYSALLRHAGCAYGDVVRLVREDGVEGALRALLRAGVFLSLDELKGRAPVVRGGVTLSAAPALRPWLRGHLSVRSSGSRGDGTAASVDLAFVRDCAVDTFLFLAARGGTGWSKAVWGVPGGMALFRLVEFAMFPPVPARWFSQLPPETREFHPRYRWSGRALRCGGRLGGMALPRAEYVPLDNPRVIIEWLGATLRAGRTPYLHTFVSSAVRLARAAEAAGVDLAGMQLVVGGEPATAARLDAIRRSGATALPRFGSFECGHLGYGCLRPAAPDDLHFVHDLHAVIQAGPDKAVARLPPGALLLSTLRGTAPLMLLNVSLGDEARLSERVCGCPLEALGWTTHVHTIRSFEKLTTGGMTFADVDVIGILDTALPARFGGGPTDYQLVDEGGAEGRPRLRLLIHPRVGAVDVGAVRAVFLEALGARSGSGRVMALAWEAGGFLDVERRPPLPGASGKILHLQLEAAQPRAPEPAALDDSP
jgi:hypothetical protein